MHNQIKLLCQILNEIDYNPNKSIQFFTGGSYKQHLNTNSTPTPNCRWTLIKECLHRIQYEEERSDDCQTVDKHVDDIFNKLNDVYQRTQYNCWQSHGHHFHTSFMEYVKCPVTCIAEISEYLEKTIKEMYTT